VQYYVRNKGVSFNIVVHVSHRKTSIKRLWSVCRWLYIIGHYSSSRPELVAIFGGKLISGYIISHDVCGRYYLSGEERYGYGI